MDNLVSMGGWHNARFARRHIPGDGYFHHRSACNYCACWIGRALHACQRQQRCELKKSKVGLSNDKADRSSALLKRVLTHLGDHPHNHDRHSDGKLHIRWLS